MFMQIGASTLFGFKSGSQPEVRGWEEHNTQSLKATSASLIHSVTQLRSARGCLHSEEQRAWFL